jgi:hypothetical protein
MTCGPVDLEPQPAENAKQRAAMPAKTNDARFTVTILTTSLTVRRVAKIQSPASGKGDVLFFGRIRGKEKKIVGEKRQAVNEFG